jgi:transcriptional regulator with XRE-family HTH domain
MDNNQFGLAPPHAIAQELGARLRSLRLQRSIAQDELAGRAGVSVSALKALEATGRSTLQTLIHVAWALGMAEDFDTLFQPKTVPSIEELERMERSQHRRRASPRRQRL